MRRIACGGFSIFVVAVLIICANILPLTNGINSENEINYKGKAFFGWVAGEAAQADGIPKMYVGLLVNANITLYGPNATLIVKPSVLLPSIVVTDNAINLHMDLFMGVTAIENDTAYIVGYAYIITWEWE